MRKKNLRYFFLTLIMALLIILPTFALIGAYSLTRISSVAESISDIPATKPTEEDSKSILLITDEQNPAFMILKFDAFGKSVVNLAIPSDIVVSEEENIVDTLSYGGPAMVTTKLESLLDVRIDYYCLLSSEQLSSLTINFKPATPSVEISERLNIPDQHVISPEYAKSLVEDAPNESKQLVRSICFSLLLEENMEIMFAEIPARIKELSGNINSNIGSEEIYRLTKIFSLLPYETVNYYAATLSGEQNDVGTMLSDDDKEKAMDLLA